MARTMSYQQQYCAKCTTTCQPQAIRELTPHLERMLPHEIDLVLSEAYAGKLIGQTLKDSSDSRQQKARSFLQVVTDRVTTQIRNNANAKSST